MAEESPLAKPRVFISYSWTSPEHQALIMQWAERLLADGVDVVLDLYDLSKGDDKYAFMEKAVTDSSVTHVLLMCDKVYTEKANSRKAGVGTEAQIISREVYQLVKQSKFIPIACETGSDGKWCLPTFLESRMGLDFTSPEKVNENWEQLIRLLFNKPLHVKPAVGKPPAFLFNDPAPASPAIAKFSTLKHALLAGKPGVELYRTDFFDACVGVADALRVRVPPTGNVAERVLADCRKLKAVRDQVVDWVLLESGLNRPELGESLVRILEDLLELKSRPQAVNPFDKAWFEAHEVFAYETFLYVVAALLKNRAVTTLHEVLTKSYMQPAEHRDGGEFARFHCFYATSDLLQVLAPEGRKLIAPAAELIKQQADRSDLSFESIMEADLLLLLMACIDREGGEWYPATLLYSQRRQFPFFIRATEHQGFKRLAAITGIAGADELRIAVTEGLKRMGVSRCPDMWSAARNFPKLMNLEKLDSVK